MKKKEKKKKKKDPTLKLLCKPAGPVSLIRCSWQFDFSWSPFNIIGWGTTYLMFLWGLTQVSINLEKQTSSFSFWHILGALYNKHGIYWGLVWLDKISIYSILCNRILRWPSSNPAFLSILRYLVPNQVSICYTTCFFFLLNLCLEVWGRLWMFHQNCNFFVEKTHNPQ